MTKIDELNNYKRELIIISNLQKASADRHNGLTKFLNDKHNVALANIEKAKEDIFDEIMSNLLICTSTTYALINYCHNSTDYFVLLSFNLIVLSTMSIKLKSKINSYINNKKIEDDVYNNITNNNAKCFTSSYLHYLIRELLNSIDGKLNDSIIKEEELDELLNKTKSMLYNCDYLSELDEYKKQEFLLTLNKED